jgi:hypothetical protein
MTSEVRQVQRPVDRGGLAWDRFQLGFRAARRTPRPGDLMVHDRRHVALLDLAAELAPEFVGPQFDHRVMRHPQDGPVGAIEGDGNLGRFAEESREFFLKVDGVPLHGNPPVSRVSVTQAAKCPTSYHKSAVFLY